MLVADGAGRYTDANPAAGRLMGLSPAQIIGRSVSDFSVPGFDVAAAWSGFVEVGRARGEFRLRRADGEIRDVEFSAVANIAPDRHLSILRDVTEAKQTAKAAQEASRRQEEFLAMLSHEVRNPLGAIAGAAELLRSPGLSDSQREWGRSVVERQTAHLTRLMDDLLDVSRMRHGKIRVNRTRIDVMSAVSLGIEIANPVIQKGDHDLAMTLSREPLTASGDINRLAQAISNLLINAAKFSERAATIWLTAGREMDEVVIRIRDEGSGISPEVLPGIFELFVQEKRPATGSDEGLGVGLAVGRAIVELHGGRVEASSGGVGRGSEFVIRLPLLPETD